MTGRGHLIFVILALTFAWMRDHLRNYIMTVCYVMLVRLSKCNFYIRDSRGGALNRLNKLLFIIIINLF